MGKWKINHQESDFGKPIWATYPHRKVEIMWRETTNLDWYKFFSWVDAGFEAVTVPIDLEFPHFKFFIVDGEQDVQN